MKLWPHMSALDQKRTSRGQAAMSALPPKADIDRWRQGVCFVPEADIAPHLHHGRIVKTTGVRSLIRFLESYG